MGGVSCINFFRDFLNLFNFAKLLNGDLTKNSIKVVLIFPVKSSYGAGRKETYLVWACLPPDEPWL